jgi:hypothetical protein
LPGSPATIDRELLARVDRDVAFSIKVMRARSQVLTGFGARSDHVGRWLRTRPSRPLRRRATSLIARAPEDRIAGNVR